MEFSMEWILFLVFVLIMLFLDLGVFHKTSHVVKVKEALIWSAVWIGLALLFNLGIYFWKGEQKALEFFTGYLIEKSLSVDNIFIFVLVFSFFKVPPLYQHKVLFWGIFGALVMRVIFIFAGVALIEQFHWIIYVFGVFLIYTGIRMISEKDKEIHPEKNPVLKLAQKYIRVLPSFEEDKFFVKRNSLTYATPLFIVLLFIETTDLIFAVDSIPAILAISSDPFIVFTSNVFAILGLRSLYFALAGIIEKFVYLSYGLALILMFVGLKMLLTDVFHIPIGISLGVIALILTASIVLSLRRTKGTKIPEEVKEMSGKIVDKKS
ncbi:MAG: TerC family protein [Ignavibacteria bacterium]|jgi:tellurite resistance protein TerC|nr:TerC family protein [Ignavibacteria bacterium]MCU7518493.1 TerC family protein [Ignavibacteria bacterium]